MVSAPGLIAGFASTGAGGLPPVKLPQLPPYPFTANADAVSKPDTTVGAGSTRRQ